MSETRRGWRLTAVAVLLLSGLVGQDLLAQNLTGTWQGMVTNPDTKEELRTVIKITSSDGNPIKGNFYSIDQTYLVFPVALNVQGSVIKVSIPGIGAEYQAKLSADGNSMTGTLKGFSVPITWTLKRVSEDQAWELRKPPTPPKPLASADPSFEVAAIKLTPADERRRGSRIQGGNISFVGVTLADLMRFIYDVDSHQIVDAPGWFTSERYDITGKAEGEGQPDQEQLKVMLRKLLSDRFQLAAHKDQKELAVYTLVVAKSGLKISKNESKSATSGVIFRGPGSVLLNNETMDEFCKMLQSAAVDRPVVNQTGLADKYEFSIVWTPDQLLTTATTNTNALAPGEKADAPPDIYTAIQQQLGLKLEGTRMRIDVLVIDKLDKLSDN
jgi:uncharacterized protein (TIGR03435 family)